MSKATILTIVFILLNNSLKADLRSDIEDARILFYKASKEEKYLLEALDQFKKISANDKENEARWKVYEGALTSMKAMYAFWPQTKLELANEGIDLMEKWIKKADNDIEALFIYGTSCYYMPFFLGQSENADWAFKRIIDIAVTKSSFSNKKLMNNVLDFFNEELDLEKDELVKVDKIRKKINS